MAEDEAKGLDEVVGKALGPAAKDFSAGLRQTGAAHNAGTVAGAIVNVSAKKITSIVELTDSLTSLSLYVSCWQRLKDEFFPMAIKKVRLIPEERVQTPPLSIAGPLLESAKFAVDEPELAELFANLLAASMDSSTVTRAHPSFVEIIRQLTPDEAKIVRHLGTTRDTFPIVHLRVVHLRASKGESQSYKTIVRNFSHLGKDSRVSRPEMTPVYIDNLCRLQLAQAPDTTYITDQDAYKALEEDLELEEFKKAIREAKLRVEFDRSLIQLTVFGQTFWEICVKEAKDQSKA
jgi:hypothetical protein